MLEYNPSYAKSVGTNEFYFPDTTRHADEIKYTRRQVTHRKNAAANNNDPGLMLDDVNVNCNKGFEKHYWDYLLKLIVKFLSTDIRFLNH